MNAVESGIVAGTILVGKYRIESVLGRGGMGLVYKAHHLALNEPVAIKVLRDDVAVDHETLTRFVREAQAAARLKSEHVARVSDVGTLEDGMPYMVMEYLEGADLGQLLDQNGAMDAPLAVDLVLQACDAIAEAHAIGTIHRDIKPTNLFVAFRPDQSPIVKVLDFGISKSVTTDLSLTQTSSMLGTPAYMSPEQMRSARTADVRSDVWSIGTVLYELVEGRLPFEADSFSEMCVMVAMDPPAPMQLAPVLGPVIERCLAKDPAHRYPNIAELAHDLARYAGNPEGARRCVIRTHRVLGLPLPDDGALHTPLPSIPTPALAIRLATPVEGEALAAASSPSMMETIEAAPTRRSWIRPVVVAAILAIAGSVGVIAATRGGATRGAATTPATGSSMAGDGSARAEPTADPTADLTIDPTADLTAAPTAAPTAEPTTDPTTDPTAGPATAPAVEVAPVPTTTTATRPEKPRTVRPRPHRPTRPTKPRPAAGSAAPAEPPPKPKCDPFKSRRGCK